MGIKHIDLSIYPPELLEAFGKGTIAPIKVRSLIGYVLSSWIDAVLLGVLLVLFAGWWSYVKREPMVIRVLVVWLVASSIGLTYIVNGLVMNTFVRHFGEYKTFLMPAWYKLLAFGGVLVKVPAAAYFLWRAYVLIGRKKWILILVVPQLALCFVSGVVLIKVFTIPYRDDIRIVIASVSACEVLSDLIVTTTIAVQLYRSRTGFAATDRLITKLLFLLAETATPPTISALIVLFFYALLPNDPAQMALTYHSKVNAICVLVSLLGKFRIADAYKAEPVTISMNSETSSRFWTGKGGLSKMFGRSTGAASTDMTGARLRGGGGQGHAVLLYTPPQPQLLNQAGMDTGKAGAHAEDARIEGFTMDLEAGAGLNSGSRAGYPDLGADAGASTGGAGVGGRQDMVHGSDMQDARDAGNKQNEAELGLSGHHPWAEGSKVRLIGEAR